ncbi:hypothetical protein [Bradyrhizobium sp. BWC-3-1]|uniref:hypothetical protein n=1 Tax=Bradyrhizobium sp. BWC-3-1 TaxID=3080012 RepID=UPI00293F2796|nr:hypothetical protein [Bradyrhizobium sp. BWC-3-1]WOH61907.1 hypothetical protein RX329_18170 [Bradyrhizobium sp. BWC-3-1]
MNADTAISIEEFHTRIADAIQAQFPDLQTVEFYREDRDAVPTPACLLDMPEFEDAPDVDPGTDQLAVRCRFEADLILGFRTPQAKLSARVLAAALAQFIHKDLRRIVTRMGPPEAIHAYRSDFKPELDKYEVWCVEWRQVVHLGESVWTNDGVIPTTVWTGISPDIGTGHEDDYTQVSPP